MSENSIHLTLITMKGTHFNIHPYSYKPTLWYVLFFRDRDTRLKNLNRYSFFKEVGTVDSTHLDFKSFKKWNSIK